MEGVYYDDMQREATTGSLNADKQGNQEKTRAFGATAEDPSSIFVNRTASCMVTSAGGSFSGSREKPREMDGRERNSDLVHGLIGRSARTPL